MAFLHRYGYVTGRHKKGLEEALGGRGGRSEKKGHDEIDNSMNGPDSAINCI